MARKGAFDPSLVVTRTSPLARKEGGFTTLPKGAAGALAQGLRAAVRDGLRDVETDLIDHQGLTDRIGVFDDDDLALRESLGRHGQLVPVLLRPSAEAQGRYEVIYGRRRVRAAKALGMPVKAIIRAMEGEEALVAQGQENTARRDLSFIEKARFARLITEDGYSREVATEALHCHPTVLSVMLNVAQDVPDAVILKIGPAPGIGRDRWFDLAKRMRRTWVPPEDIIALLDRPDTADLSSDERFTAVSVFIDAVANPPAAPTQGSTPAAPTTRRAMRAGEGEEAFANVERGRRWLTIKVPASKQPGFADWLDAHADELMNELHARYQKEAGGEE